MGGRRALVSAGTFLAAAAAVCASASTAAAAVLPTCGHTVNGRPVIGGLTPQPRSHTHQPLGTKSTPRTLYLVFRVSGCTLVPGPATRNQIQIKPNLPHKNAVDELPDAAITYKLKDDVIVEPKLLLVTLHIHPDAAGFSPGIYKADVRVSAPTLLSDGYAAIYISRSDESLLQPLGVALLCAAGGFLIAVAGILSKAAEDKKTVRCNWRWIAVAAGFAVASAVVAVDTDWSSSSVEVWTLGGDVVRTGKDAFTGASAGAVVTVLAVALPSVPAKVRRRRAARRAAKAARSSTGPATP